MDEKNNVENPNKEIANKEDCWKRRDNFENYVVNTKFDYEYKNYEFGKNDNKFNIKIKFMCKIPPIKPILQQF